MSGSGPIVETKGSLNARINQRGVTPKKQHTYVDARPWGGEGYIRSAVGGVVYCHVWEEWTPQIYRKILLWRAFHRCFLSWVLASFASARPLAMYTTGMIRVASMKIATTYTSLAVGAAHANRFGLVTLITGVRFCSMMEGTRYTLLLFCRDRSYILFCFWYTWGVSVVVEIRHEMELRLRERCSKNKSDHTDSLKGYYKR